MRGITLRALVLSCWAAACRTRSGAPTVSRAEPALGAVFSVAAWGRDSAAVQRAVARALAAVRAADASPRDSSDPVAGLMRDVATRTGLRLGPERAARGQALDRALLGLRDGVDSAILNLGGQYLIRTGSERNVGIADPDNSLNTVALITVPPGTWAVTTMSLAELPEPVEDPRTGKPADRVRVVTVVAPAAALTGAWATAFYVLGCDSALALAGRVSVGTLCVDGRVRWSRDLDGRVAVTTDWAGSVETGPAPGPARARAAAPAASGSRSPPARPDSSR